MLEFKNKTGRGNFADDGMCGYICGSFLCPHQRIYNGTDEVPDVSELRLSDAYERGNAEPDLELKITMLNINEGHNQELARKSPTLHQYMIFVDTVRRYEATMNFADALNAAVDECISNGILVDFLTKNKAEVLKMCIFEYDQERHLRQEREEAEAIGEARGEKRGRELQAQDMAREFYQKGVPMETIAEVAKVSVEVVQEWLKDI